MTYWIKYDDKDLPDAMAETCRGLAVLLNVTPGTVSYYKKVGKVVVVELEDDDEQ